MMHYAATGDCRNNCSAFSFAEPQGGRCDNCISQLASANPAAPFNLAPLISPELFADEATFATVPHREAHTATVPTRPSVSNRSKL
jgi:hypothetical protein